MNQTTSIHTTELNGEATNSAPVSIHAQRPSVTRISRRAVMLTAVFGASIGLVVLMTGFGGQRAATTRNGPEENAIRPSGTIETVRDLPADYSFDVRDAAKGIGYGPLTAQVGAAWCFPARPACPRARTTTQPRWPLSPITQAPSATSTRPRPTRASRCSMSTDGFAALETVTVSYRIVPW